MSLQARRAKLKVEWEEQRRLRERTGGIAELDSEKQRRAQAEEEAARERARKEEEARLHSMAQLAIADSHGPYMLCHACSAARSGYAAR